MIAFGVSEWPTLRFPDHTQLARRDPDRLQLYSLPTPNGVKVSIMLEEIGLPYEPHPSTSARTTRRHRSSVAQSERKNSGDHRPNGPGGKPLGLVRVRRNPFLSRGKNRQADPGRWRRALRDPPVGVCSRWR